MARPLRVLTASCAKSLLICPPQAVSVALPPIHPAFVRPSIEYTRQPSLLSVAVAAVRYKEQIRDPQPHRPARRCPGRPHGRGGQRTRTPGRIPRLAVARSRGPSDFPPRAVTQRRLLAADRFHDPGRILGRIQGYAASP